jgi:hydrogenase nickel incorporation protein HypA/HybF
MCVLPNERDTQCAHISSLDKAEETADSFRYRRVTDTLEEAIRIQSRQESRVLCWPNAVAVREEFLHEISVAFSLLEGVQETALAQGIERVKAVVVRVGALSGIAADALKFSWEVATAETIAEGSELRIEDIPLVIFCERCETERTPPPGSGVVCPDCGTPARRIVTGRELQLVAMEVPA